MDGAIDWSDLCSWVSFASEVPITRGTEDTVSSGRAFVRTAIVQSITQVVRCNVSDQLADAVAY